MSIVQENDDADNGGAVELAMTSTAEQLGVDTIIAASIQAPAKLLAVAQTTNAVSSGLAHTYVSAKLQLAVKALDQARKKDAVSSGFQQRGTAEESGVDTSIARFNECF